jgi:hypothetical protein
VRTRLVQLLFMGCVMSRVVETRVPPSKDKAQGILRYGRAGSSKVKVIATSAFSAVVRR